jgi:hypothetical protein
MRIRLETDAVQLILSHVYTGSLYLIVSPAHLAEIGAVEDIMEREHLLSTLQQIPHPFVFDPKQARTRAEYLLQQGLC